MNPRVIRDLVNRSIPGIPAYVVIWGIIAFTTDLVQAQPLFTYTILAAFVLIGLLRFGHFLVFRTHLGKYHKHHYWLLIATVVAPAVLWSILFAKFMLQLNGSEIKILMVMGTAGLAAGGNSTYAPDRRLAVSYMVILLLPTLVLMFFLNQGDLATVLLILTFFCFMLALGSKSTKEYWDALANEAKLEEKTKALEEITEKDGLTGIYNRRYFSKTYDIEWRRASREKNILTLILIDIDHFKRINDTYGHQAGDQYLKEAARTFQSIFRRCTDVVARYGGEEFVILLPATPFDDGLRLAENVRQKIEAMVVKYNDAQIRTTISIGVAACRPDFKVLNATLISEADKALYQAKQHGRNQTQAAALITPQHPC